MTHAPADALEIAGLVPLSTVDWPGRLAATLFLQGCPWSCTYCHNPALIDPTVRGSVPWGQVIDLLSRRHGMLDGVVFSGGEPTRQDALSDAMAQVRALGFQVGLHTAGAYPRRLAEVLPLVDWVGLDIKATATGYTAITGAGASASKAFASLRLVLDSGVDHEVRTTVDPTVHTGADLVALRATLEQMGVRRHVLQDVRPTGARPEYAERLGRRRSGDVLDAVPPGSGLGPLR